MARKRSPSNGSPDKESHSPPAKKTKQDNAPVKETKQDDRPVDKQNIKIVKKDSEPKAVKKTNKGKRSKADLQKKTEVDSLKKNVTVSSKKTKSVSPKKDKGDSPTKKTKGSPPKKKNRVSPKKSKVDSPKKNKGDLPKKTKTTKGVSLKKHKGDLPKKKKGDPPKKNKEKSPKNNKKVSPKMSDKESTKKNKSVLVKKSKKDSPEKIKGNSIKKNKAVYLKKNKADASPMTNVISLKQNENGDTQKKDPPADHSNSKNMDMETSEKDANSMLRIKQEKNFPTPDTKVESKPATTSTGKPIKKRRRHSVFPCNLCKTRSATCKCTSKTAQKKHKTPQPNMMKFDRLARLLHHQKRCSEQDILFNDILQQLKYKTLTVAARVCFTCKQGFKVVSHLRRHNRSVHGDPYYEEEMRVGSKHIHRTLPKQRRPHPCKFCGMNCHRKDRVIQHEIKCAQRREKATNSSSMLTCKICEKTFTTAPRRRRHEAFTHRNQRPYLCQACGKSFHDASSLKNHETRHFGKKHLSCRFCSMKFYKSNDMRKHERVHTGEKPYKCRQCSKEFSRGDARNNHEKTHLQVKLYKCDRCGKSYTQKSYMKIHMRMHTGERPFKCDHCDMGFVSNNACRIHMRIYHKSKLPHSCTICNTIFITRYSLMIHMKDDHGVIDPGLICKAEVVKMANSRKEPSSAMEQGVIGAVIEAMTREGDNVKMENSTKSVGDINSTQDKTSTAIQGNIVGANQGTEVTKDNSYGKERIDSTSATCNGESVDKKTTENGVPEDVEEIITDDHRSVESITVSDNGPEPDSSADDEMSEVEDKASQIGTGYDEEADSTDTDESIGGESSAYDADSQTSCTEDSTDDEQDKDRLAMSQMESNACIDRLRKDGALLQFCDVDDGMRRRDVASMSCYDNFDVPTEVLIDYSDGENGVPVMEQQEPVEEQQECQACMDEKECLASCVNENKPLVKSKVMKYIKSIAKGLTADDPKLRSDLQLSTDDDSVENSELEDLDDDADVEYDEEEDAEEKMIDDPVFDDDVNIPAFTPEVEEHAEQEDCETCQEESYQVLDDGNDNEGSNVNEYLNGDSNSESCKEDEDLADLKEDQDTSQIVEECDERCEKWLETCGGQTETCAVHDHREKSRVDYDDTEEFTRVNNGEASADDGIGEDSGETNDENSAETNNEENSAETNNEENSGETNNVENSGETNNEENSGETNNEENSGETNNEENSGETNKEENSCETNNDENSAETNNDEKSAETNNDENSAETNNDENSAETNDDEKSAETNYDEDSNTNSGEGCVQHIEDCNKANDGREDNKDDHNVEKHKEDVKPTDDDCTDEQENHRDENTQESNDDGNNETIESAADGDNEGSHIDQGRAPDSLQDHSVNNTHPLCSQKDLPEQSYPNPDVSTNEVTHQPAASYYRDYDDNQNGLYQSSYGYDGNGDVSNEQTASERQSFFEHFANDLRMLIESDSEEEKDKEECMVPEAVNSLIMSDMESSAVNDSLIPQDLNTTETKGQLNENRALLLCPKCGMEYYDIKMHEEIDGCKETISIDDFNSCFVKTTELVDQVDSRLTGRETDYMKTDKFGKQLRTVDPSESHIALKEISKNHSADDHLDSIDQGQTGSFESPTFHTTVGQADVTPGSHKTSKRSSYKNSKRKGKIMCQYCHVVIQNRPRLPLHEAKCLKLKHQFEHLDANPEIVHKSLSDTKSYRCHHCLKDCKAHKRLEQHSRICQQRKRRMNQIKQGMESVAQFSCNYCCKLFEVLEDWEKHERECERLEKQYEQVMQSSPRDPRFVCCHCQKVFVRKSKWSRHERACAQPDKLPKKRGRKRKQTTETILTSAPSIGLSSMTSLKKPSLPQTPDKHSTMCKTCATPVDPDELIKHKETCSHQEQSVLVPNSRTLKRLSMDLEFEFNMPNLNSKRPSLRVRSSLPKSVTSDSDVSSVSLSPSKVTVKPRVNDLTPQRKNHQDNDQSPHRKKPQVNGQSPQRKKPQVNGQSPQRKKHQVTGQSPQSKKHQVNGQSPQRKKHQVTGQSPQREKHQVTGQSPQREKHQVTGQSPQRKKHQDTGQSPQRKKHQVNDQSPQRKKHQVNLATPQGKHNKHNLKVKDLGLKKLQQGSPKPSTPVVPQQETTQPSTAVGPQPESPQPNSPVRKLAGSPSRMSALQIKHLQLKKKSIHLQQQMQLNGKGKRTFYSCRYCNDKYRNMEKLMIHERRCLFDIDYPELPIQLRTNLGMF